MDDAFKTRGNIYLNVETSLLFVPPYQNFWLRACARAGNEIFLILYILPSVDFRGEERGGRLGPPFLRDAMRAAILVFLTFYLQSFVKKLITHARPTFNKL